jgi:ferritin-like metal-binding protein YciE
MEMQSLQDLLIEELKDLYSAENQILASGPKMLKAIENEELAGAVNMHLEQTEQQVERLERVLQMFNTDGQGKHCRGMQGLLEENDELMREEGDAEVIDAGLICGQQKVEHYEIAGYGTAVTFCKLLGNNEAADLLAQSLEEEEQADKILSKIAERTINVRAAQA